MWTVLDNSSIGIYLKNIEGRCVISNRRNGELSGIDAADEISRTAEDYVPPDYAKMAMAQNRKIIESDETVTQEVYTGTRDGKRQYCLIYRILMINA